MQKNRKVSKGARVSELKKLVKSLEATVSALAFGWTIAKTVSELQKVK